MQDPQKEEAEFQVVFKSPKNRLKRKVEKEESESESEEEEEKGPAFERISTKLSKGEIKNCEEIFSGFKAEVETLLSTYGHWDNKYERIHPNPLVRFFAPVFKCDSKGFYKETKGLDYDFNEEGYDKYTDKVFNTLLYELKTFKNKVSRKKANEEEETKVEKLALVYALSLFHKWSFYYSQIVATMGSDEIEKRLAPNEDGPGLFNAHTYKYLWSYELLNGEELVTMSIKSARKKKKIDGPVIGAICNIMFERWGVVLNVVKDCLPYQPQKRKELAGLLRKENEFSRFVRQEQKEVLLTCSFINAKDEGLYLFDRYRVVGWLSATDSLESLYQWFLLSFFYSCNKKMSNTLKPIFYESHPKYDTQLIRYWTREEELKYIELLDSHISKGAPLSEIKEHPAIIEMSKGIFNVEKEIEFWKTFRDEFEKYKFNLNNCIKVNTQKDLYEEKDNELTPDHPYVGIQIFTKGILHIHLVKDMDDSGELKIMYFSLSAKKKK